MIQNTSKNKLTINNQFLFLIWHTLYLIFFKIFFDRIDEYNNGSKNGKFENWFNFKKKILETFLVQWFDPGVYWLSIGYLSTLN